MEPGAGSGQLRIASRLTPLDIKQWYRRLGGKIEPDTKIEFSTYFPRTPYEKTALTDEMPQDYLCRGSLPVHIYQPDGRIDVLALSVYIDTKGHKYKGKPIGDHYNLYLQYEINDQKTHTDRIPNRHIPLQDSVIIKAVVDGVKVKEVTINPR